MICWKDGVVSRKLKFFFYARGQKKNVASLLKAKSQCYIATVTMFARKAILGFNNDVMYCILDLLYSWLLFDSAQAFSTSSHASSEISIEGININDWYWKSNHVGVLYLPLSSYAQNELSLALDKRNLVSLGLKCCNRMNEAWATRVWNIFYRYNQQKKAGLV